MHKKTSFSSPVWICQQACRWEPVSTAIRSLSSELYIYIHVHEKVGPSSPLPNYIYTCTRKSGHPALSTCTQISFLYRTQNTQNYVHVHENRTIWLSLSSPPLCSPFHNPTNLFPLNTGTPKVHTLFGGPTQECIHFLGGPGRLNLDLGG